MSKEYVAGEQLPAAELNEVIRSAGLYAATATGNDTYVINPTPAITAYATGDVFRFKADVGNTGAASLNVSSKGAVAIKKNVSVALETGDIVAGQVVTVQYDGTNFQLISSLFPPKTLRGNGQTTYGLTTASGAQTIAHGLGKAPTKVRISATLAYANGCFGFFTGVFDVSGQHYIYGYTGAQGTLHGSGGGAVGIYINSIGGGTQSGVVSVDATNITITWTKAGSPTGTAYILWEAEYDGV